MKTTLTTIGLIILLIAGITACTNEKEKTTEVVIMYDVTDEQLVEPDTNEIMNLLELSNQWNGAKFRYMDLTDVSFNNVKETKVDPQNQLMGNEFERKKEMTNFKNSITEILSGIKVNRNTPKNNSSIYYPLANELNRLRNSNADKRILIVYSDLMENTNELSFYRTCDIKTLKTNPEKIREQLEQRVKIDSLQGIEIRLVFQPIDSKRDQIYQMVSGFYKNMLEDRGAVVTISANLN